MVDLNDPYMPTMISTGSESLDKALEGGIREGNITLVYGEPKTGKTTLLTQCAVICALKNFKTVFLDCDQTFSPERLGQIASSKLEEVAKMVMLMRPRDFKEQAAAVDSLSDYLTPNVKLVAVDTATSLYRLRVAVSPSKTFELNRELNRQLATVAQTAKIHKVAVLLASQVRTAFSEHEVSIEPVATRTVKFWADVIINLKPTEDPRTVKAIIEKGSTSTSQPLTYYLKIANSGIN